MGGEVDDLSGGHLKVLHHRHSVLDDGHGRVGAIAQLHDLMAQAVGLVLRALAQKARLLQRAQLVEQGALGHIQNAADLGQGELP